ncbi:hypothetical protein [Chitinophaga deserti]|uniref:hypothetical protein n=1 Tax=Chitinophaga deserti TaxID=2164099 RepID=UPI000D6AFB39|nr:hypothetical protein [Chitinophaga deserti]
MNGIHAIFQENITDFKERNLSREISRVESAIRKLTKLESDLEICLTNPRFALLSKAYSQTGEVLDVMYDILTILKKNNIKTPITAPSEEAKITIRHSHLIFDFKTAPNPGY